MREVTLRPRAERDLRQIGPGPERTRIVAGLRELGADAMNLDMKALASAAPRLRLRIGNYRVLYRPADDSVYVVERIVHRRDLDRAVDRLPSD